MTVPETGPRRLGRAIRGTGVTARLALALAAVALLAVALATVLSNRGLTSELNRSAQTRLQMGATHVASLAADLSGPAVLSAAARRELAHLAAVDGLQVSVRSRPIALPPGLVAGAPVKRGGETIGAVVVRPIDPVSYIEPDRQLQHRINHQHLTAALLAAVLAAAAAAALAASLTRPLRRLTRGAERIEHGDLSARVQGGGGAEMEQLAGTLNRLAATLDREDAMRREAAADLAHELRTPISGLLSRIEAAQDGVLADERHNLDAMHREAERLVRLAEDLGQLSDAQRPGLMLTKEHVDLADIARERVDAVNHQLGEHGLEVDAELLPAEVDGDPARLAQIVDNLLSNALRYSDPGGTVTVRTATHDDAALLTISDTGIGISPEDLPHIYERFWRSEKSRARVSGGTGIGLAIVRELVRAHDGQIEVQSTAGAGTRFEVRLPLGTLRP